LLLLLRPLCDRLTPNAFRNEGMTMQARIAAMKEQKRLKTPAAPALQANHKRDFQSTVHDEVCHISAVRKLNLLTPVADAPSAAG
jgi:hypothetical protein